MSLYARGDTVSLSRAQAVLLTVLTSPGGPEDYSADLEVGDEIKTFTFSAVGTESINEVAAGLAAILQNDQTPYSIALVEETGYQIMIVGPLGLAFDVPTTSNMGTEVTEEAILGDPPDDLRVIASENVVGMPPREYATKEPDGTVREVNMLSVRALGTGDVFEVDAERVQTIIDRAVG